MRRPWGAPLIPLYGAGTRVKNWLYDRGSLPARRLRNPVISVGSLSAGGAGKTPVVRALADLLEQAGLGVDVLSRGYGRTSQAVAEVDPAGTAEEFGDEPLELARAGLRVFVGAERWAAGTLAEQCGGAAVHLLDDGFQHRRLARSLDVVLLTLEDVGDALLPGGNLREPLESLRRADAVVVREEEAGALAATMARCAPRAAVWVVRRELQLPAVRPRRPLIFCALARGESFVRMLPEHEWEASRVCFFPDHHRYSAPDIDGLALAAESLGADGFYTTAKDAVKLTAPMLRTLERVGPVVEAALRLRWKDEAALIDEILRLLRK